MSPNEQAPRGDAIKTATKIEIKEAMQRSKEFQDKIKSAKTSTKRDFYKKKLAKNNMMAMKLLVALEQMTKT